MTLNQVRRRVKDYLTNGVKYEDETYRKVLTMIYYYNSIDDKSFADLRIKFYDRYLAYRKKHFKEGVN